MRHRISVRERDRAWSHDLLPAAFAFRDCVVTFPRPARAGLAAGMGQPHSRDASLFMNKPDDLREHLDMPVIPDAKVLRTDPAFRQNRRRLRQDHSGATDRPAAEMNEMPVVRVPVFARILAHRRHEHPIGKRQISNRERIEQAGHGRWGQ